MMTVTSTETILSNRDALGNRDSVIPFKRPRPTHTTGAKRPRLHLPVNSDNTTVDTVQPPHKMVPAGHPLSTSPTTSPESLTYSPSSTSPESLTYSNTLANQSSPVGVDDENAPTSPTIPPDKSPRYDPDSPVYCPYSPSPYSPE